MARQYHKNPRQITRDQMTALEEDLATLGDLGGIVHDLNSDEIIGGNQRSRVFDINACDVELVAVNDEPDDQGTVAHGFVLWEGKRYSYRQVRWSERQAERANIVANKRGGSWDFDILADQFEVDDLLDWGFEPFELGMGEGNDIDELYKGMPEFEQDDNLPFFSIKVHFASQDDVDDFSRLISQPFQKPVYIWHPKQIRENLKQFRVIDE